MISGEFIFNPFPCFGCFVLRYVDKMLEMIAVAGDSVAGAVWHRIIQIVTNHKDLQVVMDTLYRC